MHAIPEGMSIGPLARAGGVTVETVRFYQRRGLLREPAKHARGIRRYGQSDLLRLRFIRAAQRLGFSLTEVAELLRLEDGTHCAEARVLAERKLTEVRAKLEDLARLEVTLSSLVKACRTRGGTPSCPLIASLHGQPQPTDPTGYAARTD